MNTCKQCNQIKPLTQFSKSAGSKSPYKFCKECVSINYSNNPKAKESAHWRHLKATYGMSKEDYTIFLEKQGHRCAICGSLNQSHSKMLRLCVDHKHDNTHTRGTKDHTKIRGLLCNNCNHGIGKFNDDPELLRNAINYLESRKD